MKILVVVLGSMLLCACGQSGAESQAASGQNEPIDIQVQTKHESIGTEYNGDEAVGSGPTISWDEIQITGKTDHVVIKGIIANRGNCRISSSVSLPATLAFGQRLDIPTSGCNVIEVAVDTDQGSWQARFQ